MTRYLDPELIAKIATLPFRTQRLMEGALTGHHRSRSHGSSVEFAEHKVYSPGDELRHLDWKAYGKLDKFYVRRFERETELRAYLVIDGSASMGYRSERPGALSKLEYASYVAASLAYLLLHQQDAAGLLAFGAERQYVPPRASTRHLFELAAALERVTPAGTTDVAGALTFIGETAARRGTVIVLSDLFDDAERVGAALRHLVARHHQVLVLHVLDGDELEFPFEGLALFESMEDDRRVLVDARAARAAFVREMHAFVAGYRQRCLEAGVAYLLLPTTRPLDQAMAEVLAG